MSDTKTLGDSMAELAGNIEAYNKWRRGSDLPHPDPEAIGLWLSAAVDVLRAQAAQAQAETYAWAVSGLGRPFYGEFAEQDARAEARRCGGTSEAFPLYRHSAQPEPAVWECKAGGLRALTQRHYEAQSPAIKRHYTSITPQPAQPSPPTPNERRELVAAIVARLERACGTGTMPPSIITSEFGEQA